jgi:hypothetical protein
MKIIILALLTVLFVSQANSQGKVEYVVNSSSPGLSITYTNEGGNTEQKKVKSTLWKTSFIGTPNQFVYISAQTLNKNTQIGVKIIYNGEIIERANSNGDYVVASASGKLRNEMIFPDTSPYTKNYTGTKKVNLYAPILKEPDMSNSEKIGFVESGFVVILSKYNNGYYMVKSGSLTGYLWAGWFID